MCPVLSDTVSAPSRSPLSVARDCFCFCTCGVTRVALSSVHDMFTPLGVHNSQEAFGCH